MVVSLAHANLCRNVSFRKEKPHAEGRQSLTSDFEGIASAANLPRENRPAKRATDRAGLAKAPAATADMTFTEDGSPSVVNSESSRIITNGLTLVSLHCQLTV